MALYYRRSFRSVQFRSHTMVRSVQPRRRQRHGLPAYVLVVDESSSTGSSLRMAFGRNTTRMAAIRTAGQDYLQHVTASNPRHLAAVVGFSDTARLYHGLAPVGRAFGSLSRAVRSLQPRGLTDLSAGLDLALRQLAKANGSWGNLVVITDGAANRGNSRLPGLIKQARSLRARIFTIGVGNIADADYDRDLLVEMARSTGGRFASAHSFVALSNALRRAI